MDERFRMSTGFFPQLYSCCLLMTSGDLFSVSGHKSIHFVNFENKLFLKFKLLDQLHFIGEALQRASFKIFQVLKDP